MSGATLTNNGSSMAELARIEGHWDHTVRSEICMFQPGNPCDYHYHDGDEYWVVFRGHFDIDYHGLKCPTRPGELLAFGKGYEHGLLHPEDVMQAIVLAMPPQGASATATSTASATARRPRQGHSRVGLGGPARA